MLKLLNHSNDDVLSSAKTLLQDYFTTDLEINNAILLSKPERRNIILRLFLENKSQIPKTIILKQSLEEETDEDDKEAYARFSRDWAGLEFANKVSRSVHNVPKFYGGNKELRFILIEDLGQQHISLVDALTLPCDKKAITALERFMKALGNFHADGFGNTNLYENILLSIDKNAETIQEELDFTSEELLATLESVHKTLNIQITSELIKETKILIESLFKPGPFTVLTHGDICPDNVFDHQDTRELQLIDFEWACVRSALLDGTYLRMSMPTCWCAKAIPSEHIELLEQIYREALKHTIPAARDDKAYAKAYTEACGFWMLQQALPFISSVMNNDRIGPSDALPENSLWKPDENLVRPRVLARLQAFIEVATKFNLLPNLREMAISTLNELKKLWPDTVPLAFYPALDNWSGGEK